MGRQTIRDFAAKVRKWARVPSRVATPFSKYVEEDLRRTFTAQTTPEGDPWDPYTAGSIRRGRRPPLLQESGALLASLRAEALQGAGVRARFADDKANLFQLGTKHMVARRILPRGRKLLPRWRTTLVRLIREEYRRA